MPHLKLHNSLSGEKEDVVPLDPAHVRVYACGPTVYSYAHIGNARMAVAFDQLVRVLRRLYPRITYVSNITDVDDKIMAAAAETGEAIDVITRKFEQIYNDDMAALGVVPPDIQPRATEHIAEMIVMIATLIDRGHAYAAQGHVLFHVPSYPAYGRLSRRSRDDQVAGARVEISPFKKDPADFVLWKPSGAGQPGWDSPWGRGRPGWHIECSAMAEKHLDLPFDIHGGGADLKFPHHENEIAQSCCAHGIMNDPRGFAQMWVHNGFVTVEGEKMSKSLGNTVLAHDLLGKHDGEVIRMALLSAHYRQPLDWSEALLHQTKKLLDTLYRALYDMRDIAAAEISGDNADSANAADMIMTDLCDDLNTPKVIATLNFLAAEKTPGRKRQLLDAGELLGILRHDPAAWFGYGAATRDDTARIDSLLAERQVAKKQKDFTRADAIRRQLEDEGILVEDTPAGPVWRRAG